MKTHSWLLNRQVLSTLCAAPLLFSSVFANAGEAAPAEAVAPVVEAAPTEPTADHLDRKHTAPAEPASPHTFTVNLGVYTQYMFRGVALSDGPALQGGADYAHSSGFYAGTWFSNIDKEFFGFGDGSSGGARVEIDIYAGWAKTFENGLGVNFLGNYYWYPEGEKSFRSTAFSGQKQDVLEVSAALSYKWLTYTFYYIPTDYYGANRTDDAGTQIKEGDTEGATYHELKFAYALPFADLNLLTKVAYQKTPGLTADQGDWAIGINRNFSLPSSGKPIEGFNAGAVITGTFDVENQAYYNTFDGRDTNKGTLTFFVKRTW